MLSAVVAAAIHRQAISNIDGMPGMGSSESIGHRPISKLSSIEFEVSSEA